MNELLEYNEVRDSHKGFEIRGWEYKVLDPETNKKSTVSNAEILNFHGHPKFSVSDSDGSKLSGAKHAINACKKIIDDVERLELAAEEYSKNFDGTLYEEWKNKIIKQHGKSNGS